MVLGGCARTAASGTISGPSPVIGADTCLTIANSLMSQTLRSGYDNFVRMIDQRERKSACGTRLFTDNGTVSRLAGKGIVVIDKDRSRQNTATVRLTPLGESLYSHIAALRARLGADLDGYLAGYSPAELATVARFVADLHRMDRAAGLGMPSVPVGG